MRSDSGTSWLPRACLLVCLAAFMSAPALGRAADEPTLGEALDARLPGRENLESLERALTPPSSGARWRGLPVFGRDLFASADARFEPVADAPVAPDYVLGPGDQLVLFASGLSDTSYTLAIDREGKVFVPRVGTVFLWGLAFADAESLLRARLATVFRNTRVQVSMGRVRALDVFVLGAAHRPGKVTLNGLATALHALAAAGGPDALGSLRDVRVLRGKQHVGTLDLYDFLLRGDRSGDVRLQAGDVVFVGLAQAQVGVQGEVRRPGVYETTGPVTLRALLEMAGGATPFADVARIRIERVDPHGGFRLQDVPLNHGRGVDPDSLMLSSYDLVTVFPLRERTRNVVTLDGFVRQPGEYELAPGMRLSALLTPDRLLPEADLERAELRRVDPRTFQVEVRAIAPRDAWSGTDDPELRPLDAVSVYSSARFPRSVIVEGEVARPGAYTIAPEERLSSVLDRAGGVRPRGHLPAAVFVRRSAARHERTVHTEFVQRQTIELARRRAELAAAGDTAAAAALARAEADLAAALAIRTDPGRVVLELDPAGRWRGTARDPVLEDGDRFVVPTAPAVVSVVGSVMNPGSVLARRGASFADYVRLAGGATRHADLARAYVLRANGAAVPRADAGRIGPGDALVVPPRESKPANRLLGAGGRFLGEIAGAAALIYAATR